MADPALRPKLGSGVNFYQICSGTPEMYRGQSEADDNRNEAGLYLHVSLVRDAEDDDE